MSRQKALPLCFMLVSMAVGSACTKAEPDTVNIALVQTEISQTLQLGSSPEQAAAFFSRGDQQGEWEGATLRPFDRFASKAKNLPDPKPTYEFGAIKRGVRKNGLVTSDIVVSLYYDEQRRLIHSEIREVHSGL